jgi:hypothetical protein
VERYQAKQISDRVEEHWYQSTQEQKEAKRERLSELIETTKQQHE